jgi:hypothetical protein
MKKISIILLQLILFSFGYSEDLRPRYSAFGQVGLDIHLADFRALPNAPSCCPQYKIGYGLGYGFGAGFEFPINENTFVGSKLFYNSSQGLLASQESTLVIVNLTEQLGVIEHSIDSKFVIAGISPFIGKNFENTNISLGANIGYITSGTYSQKEQIVEPSNTGYFKENNSRIRNVSSGDIQNLNKLMFGIFAEISYDLKMNISNTLFFSPNLNLGYSFTNFVQNLDWKFFSAKAGIAIKYSPKDLKKTNYEYFKADTVKYLDENILSEVFHLGQTESKIQELEFEDSLVINKYYSRTDTIFKPRSKNISKKETKIEKTEIAELAAPKIIDTPQIKNEVINSKKTEIAEIPSIENIKKDTIVHFGTPREIVNNNLLYISEDPDGKNKLQSFFIKGKSVKEFEPILNYIFFDYNSEKIDTRYLS